MSSAYLRLLILSQQSRFQLLLHPAHDFAWCIYCAYKLNKQGDNIQYSFPSLEPVHCCISVSNSCFLTCIHASQETSEMVWYSHLFKNLPQFVVMHTVKDFCISQWSRSSCFSGILLPFFYDPSYFGNLISDSSAYSKSCLNIWKFLVHVLLKPSMENFEHYFASMWNEYNYAVAWTFFDTVFLWDWNENWPFPVLWSLLDFPNLLLYWLQHFNSIIS